MVVATNFLGLNVPQSLIARNPLPCRDKSKLFITSAAHHDSFENLAHYMTSDDLVVVNDTKVQPCRLIATKKHTLGRVELLFTQQVSLCQGWAIFKASHKLRVKTLLTIGAVELEVIEQKDRQVLLKTSQPLERIFAHYGLTPLPSYMNRTAEQSDNERYQSIWAKSKGSCAAPTASLHFTPKVLHSLQRKKVSIDYCTLHIGLGTFLPVKGAIENHVIHKEYYNVSQGLFEKILHTKKRGGRIVAVGTSVTRALESTMLTDRQGKPRLCGKTSLFIKPGYQFKIVDRLITNFHQPDSTLMLLVQAFSGKENIYQYYREAFTKNYRLYSYGDAMLLENNPC